jgi:hypothetical protein
MSPFSNTDIEPCPPSHQSLYEKFLDFQKDADPGISEMEDVRKRLAGLEI